ncbi:MAG: hypothetical protein ACHP8B_17790 [Terriglobales bacterium]
MFEDEVEMERRSSFLPLVLMLSLLVLIVGTVAYVIFQVRSKTPLTADQATPIVTATLQGPGPAVIHFRVGLIKADENPDEPNYRLLQKAGIVKLAKAKKGDVTVSLTPDGERLLSGLPGFKKSEPKDDSYSCQAPLAERQLLGIAGVEMNDADHATVTYNWKWLPNALGDVFDAGGPLVKSFGVWERQTLISKYQAAFYHGDPTISTLTLVRQDRQWKLPAR